VTTRYMLDTNIVGFHVRSSSPALQRRLRKVRADRVALSVVTEMEIRYGLARDPGLRIAPLVEGFLDGITVLPLDSSVATVYGRVRAELEATGMPIGPLDLMIGSHALAVRATLVTSNTREFRRIPGLVVEDWTR
jgi:tRNA(fMet)-specific endonuclease VapC